MKHKTWYGILFVTLLAGFSTVAVAAESPPAPTAPARLVAVAPVKTAHGTVLEVRLSGSFTYTSYQPDSRSLVLDLAGVVSESVTPGELVGISWLESYRLLPFRNASGRQVLRLDLALSRECEVALSQASASTLSLSCDTANPKPGFSSSAKEETSPAVRKASHPIFRASRKSSGPVIVQRVRVNADAEKVVVEIDATGPLGYETLELKKPARLVVDLPGGVLRGRARKLAVSSPWVFQVRVAQFKAKPPVTRVVLDLNEWVPHRIEETETGLRVVLSNSPESPVESSTVNVPAQSTPKPAEDTTATKIQDNPVTSQNSSSESSSEAAQEKKPVEPIASEPVQIASLAPMVPSNLTTSAVSPVPSAAPTESASTPAPVNVPAAKAVEASETVQAPSSSGGSSSSFQVPATAASDTSKFTGDPISVNLQDVDLKDFFRLIHEISGLNIVIDPNVSGAVTLVLIDVPWDQALDIVLANNGLDHSLEGNVLRIATRNTLKRESEEKRDLAQARAEAVDPVTITRELNYAKAADVEATLTRFLSSRGLLIRDDRTNTLIIRDIPSVIPAIEDLLRQLDRKSKQVEIQARVVTARRNFLREFGTQLGFSSGTRNRKQLWGGGLGANEGFIDRTIPPLPPVVADSGGGLADGVATGGVPLATNLGAVGANSALFYNFASANFALDLVLSAAENRGIAKVISRPRIITQNNVLGFVKQGARIPVQTEINNTISTQFIDAVLELNVTPQVTGDGNVFLKIDIRNDRPDFGQAVNGVPSIVTQQATTQVLVNDGGTVVIGGVMVTDNATTIDQVPFLGSIPIIGHLFKRTSVRTSTEELLFFITPRILPD